LRGRFQVELLRRLLGGDGEAGLRAFGRETAARLPWDELDRQLVHRKALRRPAEAYETQTPQVRATRLLGWTDRRGRVDLERQLRPIAQSIARALGTTADDWLGDAGQLGLFTSPDIGR
jgi:hypothetical protein